MTPEDQNKVFEVVITAFAKGTTDMDKAGQLKDGLEKIFPGYWITSFLTKGANRFTYSKGHYMIATYQGYTVVAAREFCKDDHLISIGNHAGAQNISARRFERN